jgi:hypothetical protein
MKLFSALAGSALFFCACSQPAGSRDSARDSAPHRVHRADVLVAWNERVLAIAEAEDKFLTLKGVRTAAMMHIAMHDALNATHRRYAPYAYDGEAPDADPTVAVAQAAYEVAVDQYPAQRAQLTQDLQRWIEPVTDGTAKSQAIALGKASAAAILQKRRDDGWNRQAKYRWHPMGPGVYAELGEHSGTPHGFVFGAGWATVTPFVLRSPAQFRSPPPPAIDSDEYTLAFDEVKEIGRHDSRSRTHDQTHIAMWWKDFAENSHNRLARQLVVADDTDLWVSARLFALLNIGIMDGYISVFDNKFFYNHWRPYTAIRWADNDGNPRTLADPEWNNTHRHTYAFPSYPSAHGTVCAAAMIVMADVFGDAHPFRMETLEVDSAGPMSAKVRMNPSTRSFDRFSSAAMECAMSRVYLGIHFRYDSIEGNRLGRQIGDFVLETALRPVRRAH